ncbi:F420H2 dehydrogenase subunit FpoO [Methanolobus halotolerans]|uniref:F420H2 dehydrogenase n=1 Tax=Methanolobus halotolerans TaxID=2052935 RepID=A0A4E0QBZ0_9EURY|nr:F420H2 dehydrogenase subunit FpoO [Methanolobus halotolerans]TGC10704.1 F420H2 dehydrogenase [Methanolobus halotolerans]
MADCDLCGVALPTLVPVKVYKPGFADSYPQGMWQGLCEQCVSAAIKANQESTGTGTTGTCQLCGSAERLFDVHISRPSFSKGAEGDTVHICKRCLNSIEQAKVEWDRDKATHPHEHITD